DVNASVSDLMSSEDLRNKISLKNYVSETVGLPTLQDILEELAKPGRDPRETFEVFAFEESVNSMTDLKVGMKLPGVVTNITAFGAFVDVGVHQDGLVHLSHLADRFVKDPNEIVSVNQKVQVTVMEIDIPRKRVGLSMKSDPFAERVRDSKSRTAEKRPVSKAQLKEPEGSMADKLAALKGKFGG